VWYNVGGENTNTNTNMKRFYRLILVRAFNITWKNKWLWLFGLVAVFISSGGIYDFLTRAFGHLIDGKSPIYVVHEYWSMNFFRWAGLLNTTMFSSLANFSTFAWGVLSLIVILIVLALAVIAQIGLIKSAISLDKGQVATPKLAIREGKKDFWPVLKLNVLIKVGVFAILFFLAWALSLVVLDNSAARLIFYTISFVVLLLLIILIHFITLYSIAYIILRKDKVLDSLGKAWHLFRKNIVVNLEMGLLLFLFNLLVSFCSVIVILIVESPLILFYMLMYLLGAQLGALVVMFLMMVVFVILVLIIIGWFSSFQTTAWMILFDELDAQKGEAKITKLVRHLLTKMRR